MKNLAIIACLICNIAATAISDSEIIWSEASPDQRLLATIRRVPGGEEKNDPGWLRIMVFRRGRNGTPGQRLASTDISGRVLNCAHWSPDSQFLLFTTSLARGAHGGGHFEPFVYCVGDHSFRSDLERVSGDVIAPEFRFDSPDIAVLTVRDDDAPSEEEMPSKQVKITLGKVVDRMDRLP
jgi:hypothetical protein